MIILFLTHIILNALGDAFNQTRGQTIGHGLNALGVLALLLLPVVGYNYPLWVAIVIYVLLRFALFDYFHNLVTGQDWYYHSPLHAYGKLLSKIGPWPEAILKVASFLTAFLILRLC
jgi:hypothetical protein